MPMIRFTKLIDKVLNHQKKQTIRLPRKIPENWKVKKEPVRIGDTLHVYVLLKVGTAQVTDIKRKKLIDITDQEMIDDGFDDPVEGKLWLAMTHKIESSEQEFDLIKYEPDWPKQMIVEDNLAFLAKYVEEQADNYHDEIVSSK